MKSLRTFLDKIKPNFQEGGKLSAFQSVFDGMETFLFVPSTTSKSGVHIHDARDSKRTMSIVLLALMPSLLFGMYNAGLQHYLAFPNDVSTFWDRFLFGLIAFIPKAIVSYGVGLGIEFISAQIKKEEIQEGFLVTGMLIPMIVPIDTPLWMLAVATAFAVIFAKEVFGGTGYNIVNVALVARAFLFFGYPLKMSGDQVFIRLNNALGLPLSSAEQTAKTLDSFSGATPLGQLSITDVPHFSDFVFHGVNGAPITASDMFFGFIPGSFAETSLLAILLGAIILIATNVGSWKIMLSVFLGGAVTVLLCNLFSMNLMMEIPLSYHFLLGGFAFGAIFMATDPVTSARTETGKWIYGFLIGVFAILIRVFNAGYPEGMMLAIILMNVNAPLIDYFVVDANVRKRMKRALIRN